MHGVTSTVTTNPEPLFELKSHDWIPSNGSKRSTYSQSALKYFEAFGRNYEVQSKKMQFFNEYTSEFLASVVQENKKVLMVGCLSPELLKSMKPELAVGLTFSHSLAERFKQETKSPRYQFSSELIENYQSTVKFDAIVLLNVADHCQDFLLLVESLRRFVHEDTKIIVTMLNPWWHAFLRIASSLKIRIPDLERNLVPHRLLFNALEIKRYRVSGIHPRILIPRKIPFFSKFFNQFVARLPLFKPLCFTQYIMATPNFRQGTHRPSVSVLIPCFNEEGNIKECIERVPNMGRHTEILVIDDGSRDKTAEIVRNIERKDSRVRLISYSKNKGKGGAVLEGMKASRNDILMILDADMTVPPEELVDFYDAMESKAAQFAVGTRFLYPMEREAMRFANFIGNRLFSKLIEIIVGYECSDTLCGTKAMFRKDFENFKLEDRSWGDFDLIFHAARLKLQCLEVPVHYKSRVAGESKMHAFSAGITFLKMCLRKWSEIP